ncbi:MAG: hypothetical protein ABIH17_08910 [Pseudomonadota bacterium]
MSYPERTCMMCRVHIGMVAAGFVMLSACASAPLHESVADDGRAVVFEAERAFAVAAQTEGAKQGFLSVLSDDSIVFTGSGVVSGIARYSAAPESRFSLAWWPVEGEGAASDDLFFSTGPYVLASDGQDRGFGQYLSVWQRQADGSIRLLADHGISLPADLVGPQHAAFSGLFTDAWAARRPALAACEGTLEAADAALNAVTSPSASAILLRNDQVSTVGTVSGAVARFQMRRAAMAASGDLGMTAGEGKANEAGGTVPTYLRIWTRSGCKWQVLIDLES